MQQGSVTILQLTTTFQTATDIGAKKQFLYSLTERVAYRPDFADHALALLGAAVEDPEVNIRRTAHDVLGHFCNTHNNLAVPCLAIAKQGLNDPDTAVRKTAERNVGTMEELQNQLLSELVALFKTPTPTR